MSRIWGEEYRTTFVCVDSYEHGVLQGRFYNPYLSNGKAFHSLSHFLQEMEQTLNLMDFPKAFTVTHTFAKPPETASWLPKSECQIGEQATFAVKIMFRQNASWQGSITWLEGKREQSFRSVLELIMLMNSALVQEQAS